MQHFAVHAVLLLLFSCLIYLLSSSAAQVERTYVDCNSASNYTSGSVFEQNLNRTIASLVSSSSLSSGFSITSVGQNLDVVYGLVYCIAEQSDTDCQACANLSAMEIRSHCPNQKEGYMYSDWRFFSTADSAVIATIYNRNIATRGEYRTAYIQNEEGSSPQRTSSPREDASPSTTQSTNRHAALMAQFKQELQSEDSLESRSEVDRYLAEKCEDEGDNFDLLNWWKKVATKNFSDSYKLGQGGFGPVYKGKLIDGREIAVKRLAIRSSGQGLEELKTEVVLVAKLLHRNLIRLLGFCLEDGEKLLVYEYLPNGSLHEVLFDQTKRFSLEWERRYKIIVGIARGLLYLHEDSQLRIIHWHLKPSNILLDENMNPKISDFGLARLFGVSQTQGNTNRIAGTFGYIAPEYAKKGNFSTKSDVYSFGVLVLEIVAGQKNSSFRNGMNLQSYLIDPTLGDQWTRHEVLKCIHSGLLCVQEAPVDRPKMSEIATMLSGYTASSFPAPSQPAFFQL
ncbi:hypothetical protein I3760_04G117200, partial [Carya illinoinensis]